MIARLKAFLKRYWPPLSLRTILFGTLLFVAALPGVGAVFLRVYENTLVQQTEAELIAQSAVLASAYRAAWTPKRERHQPAPEPPRIDLQANKVLPLLPAAQPAGPADPRAIQVAWQIERIADGASAVTLSLTRLLDAKGVVVAGRDDVGKSYAALPEVRGAMTGKSATVLRERFDGEDARLASPALLRMLSTAPGIRVHHVRPVMVGGKVVGMVMVARSPRGLFLGIYQDRGKIALGVVLIFLTLVVLAGILSRAIARPIRALAAASENVAQGRIDIPEPPVTAANEIRELYVNFARMAERIEARARYLRDFAAAVSHEFKTPLTGIRGALELLDEHGAGMGPERRAKFLANAAADADRLSRLVQRLLDLARADMTVVDEEERTDAVALARGLAERLGGEGLVVTVEAAPGVPAARISADALETVLTTLIENSRQAEAQAVTIAFLAGDEELRITVSDDGKGVDPADAGRIFEPFFTANRATGGTGLGLPISRSLLAATGGAIVLEPSRKGACFRLSIPAAS